MEELNTVIGPFIVLRDAEGNVEIRTFSTSDRNTLTRQEAGELAHLLHAQSTNAKLERLSEDIALLRETMDTSIKHLAAHVDHLAQQFSRDHQQRESE